MALCQYAIWFWGGGFESCFKFYRVLRLQNSSVSLTNLLGGLVLRAQLKPCVDSIVPELEYCCHWFHHLMNMKFCLGTWDTSQVLSVLNGYSKTHQGGGAFEVPSESLAAGTKNLFLIERSWFNAKYNSPCSGLPGRVECWNLKLVSKFTALVNSALISCQ